MIHAGRKIITLILIALTTMVCTVAYADKPSGQSERSRVRSKMPWGGQRGRSGPALSSSEKQQLKALAIDTLRRTRQDLSEIAKRRRALREYYKIYRIDEAACRTAIDSLNQAQSALLKLHLETQVQIRQKLSRESFDSLRNVLAHIGGSMQKMPRMPRGDRNWRLPQGVQPTARQSEVLGRFQAERTRILSSIASNAKLLVAVYSKYELDEKAASVLIGRITRDQAHLARLNHRLQQALRGTMTEDEFNATWRQGPAQPRNGASPK